MGFFDIFRKAEKGNKPLTTLKIGDWITQYSAGYWKVVAIFLKYADEDYSYNGQSWKKGDRLGDWVVLKKGFTAKMKPSNACEFLDSAHCQIVSQDVARAIEAAFAENPKAKEKFDNAPSMPNPSVYSVWMSLSDEQADSFARLISDLPNRFTLDEFWKFSADYRQYIVKPLITRTFCIYTVIYGRSMIASSPCILARKLKNVMILVKKLPSTVFTKFKAPCLENML